MTGPGPGLPGFLGSVAPLLDHYGYLAVGGLLLVEDFGIRRRGKRCSSPRRSTPAPAS
ncbi:MAG: hypothetical protein ACRDRO_17660 [Pseudonocardiaceae bacterium]